jgi:anti-anti-sigma factor
MELREERIGATLVVSLRGRLDSATAPEAGARLVELVAPPPAGIVIDLERLEYLTSAGFRALLLARRRADQLGSPLALCGLSDTLRRLFEVGGFMEVFRIHADRAAALAAVAAIGGRG